MTRRRTFWLVAAGLFTVINVLGFVYAIAMREGPHAALHVGLLLLTYGVWRFASQGTSSYDEVPRELPAEERLGHLQQSVDAIAIEVERIGEAQRFDAKLKAERDPKKL